MKKKITLLRVIVTSFAMFSIFFGAGNFILPPRLGQQAGDHWLLVAIGFCLSAVLIPIAGILVQARLQGSVLDFGKKVSPTVALILGCLLYGMCLAFPMPRTASVSYEMVSTSFTGTIPAWAKYFFYIVYFLLVGYLCYQRNKVLDVLGKYLTPIMVGIIFLLILKAIFSISDIEISSFQKPLAEGLKEGYQTYDAMSSIIIGGVISASLFMDNSLDKSQVKRLTIYSGIGSGILLFITYTGFIYAGASQGGYFPAIVERVPLLVAITKHVLGGVGGLLLSIAVGISCFTTAVGIITGGADFFKEITKGDERTYRIFVTILCVYCVIVAPYGVEYIIKIAYPILVLFYPVVIILIFLHLLPSYLASKTVFKVVSLVTFVTTIPLFLEQLGYHFFEVPFPLHEYGVSWLFPAFWAWITTVLIEKTIVKSKK
ncbi:branched-chain amino acid transport system II carrier protein [Capnocytophaga gingivalis]|uniref:branched-chain amino acid transport system II carrier protein n=1 Tax=Capnocytophaga gingivalis TaxID=1017 RepID=UPI0023F81076|nr:branched-chain amino acid transport system II carrier protein [Capnocytophaga gingivalis]